MDEIQKQIIGYLLMSVFGAVVMYLTYKIGIWVDDPVLVSILGFILGAIEVASYKWIRYTFKIPDTEPDPVIVLDKPPE